MTKEDLTVCAWCGRPLTDWFVGYNGELICCECYDNRENESMDSYDKWKTTPPDSATTKCKCAWCGEELYFDDEYWELDDEILCEDCADKWLDNHKNWVSESMAYGDR